MSERPDAVAGEVLTKAEQAVRRLGSPGGEPGGVTLVLNKRGRSLWPLAFAAVVLGFTAAVLAVVLFPMWAAKDMAEKAAAGTRDAVVDVARTLGDAMRPDVVRRETVTIVSEQAQNRSKLVVYEHPVRVQVQKSDEYRLLWDYLYLGQNTATLRIDGNRVQWVVDLAGFGEEDVVVDEAAKRVTLRFPPARLDADMVVVQTDPSRIQVEAGRGWARWPGSADGLVDQAKGELRPRIIAGANTPANRGAANAAAEEALENLFQPTMARLLPPDWTADVRVMEDAGDEPVAGR